MSDAESGEAIGDKTIYMKKLFSITMLLVLSFILIAGMVCVSCSDDDGLDNDGAPPLTEIEKSIVGGWPELGDDGITFLQNGLLIHNNKVGHWQYDEAGKILTTDVMNKRKQVLIWQINMLQDGSMVGIQVWDGATFSAKRNVAQAVKDILDSRSWTRDKNNKLLVIRFGVDLPDEIIYSYVGRNSSFWIGYNAIRVSEQDFTSITIMSGEYGKYIIHNPYNNDKVWFEFPGECKYYPVTAGMGEVEKVEMSKDESKLVGKWICQEQIWDKEEPGHLYFEAEYGMEFYDNYWGKMWAGKDELMETMHGGEFTWWVKDGKLYIDNDLYYILKLTDKEMELEWRDFGNIITCKFYKYDENEGLLIDRLEYVDLGLSVKWATRNLGAEDKDASRLGNFYAWGETSPKEVYTPDNYKYCKKGSSYWSWGLTKYCSNPHAGYNGFVDNKTVLDPEDDAAIAVRGKEWRMPTIEEYKELMDNCTWEWGKDSDGNVGYRVTGKTGYYIFLPAAGYKWGEAWSGEYYEGNYLTNSTGGIDTCDGIPGVILVTFGQGSKPYTAGGFRCAGYSIRPVHK